MHYTNIKTKNYIIKLVCDIYPRYSRYIIYSLHINQMNHTKLNKNNIKETAY